MEPVYPNRPQASTERVTIGLRLGAALLDNFIFGSVISALLMPVMFANMIGDLKRGIFNPVVPDIFFPGFILGYALFFCKDIFNGRSPAKRILKLQVTDIRTGQVAGPLRCLVRNLSIFFWPLEFIFILINPKRRLGDLIAGTQIEYVEKPEPAKRSVLQKVLAICVAIAFSTALTMPFYFLNRFMADHMKEFYPQPFWHSGDNHDYDE